MHIGKPPFVPDERDLLFRNYRRQGVVLPIPPSGDYGHDDLVANFDMLGNGPDDSVFPGFQGAGDCVWAAGGHETMVWTAVATGVPAPITGANAIADYSAVTKYNPVTGANDNGTQIRDALKYRQKTGLIDSQGVRHQIGAYLLLDLNNLEAEAKETLYLFEGVEIGLQFPDTAMAQFDNGQVWVTIAGASIEGGHDVPILKIRGGDPECVTWAKKQLMTWDFATTYCDEAWAILSKEMLNGQGKSAEGFDYTALNADLDALSTTPVADQVTVTVKDAAGTSVSANFDLTIEAPAVSPLVITTTGLTSDTQGMAYAFGVFAKGGTTPYKWSASGLPAGLTLDSASGMLSGVPTVNGDFSVVVKVTDSSTPQLSAMATFTLVIKPPNLSIVTASLPDGEADASYSAQMHAYGGLPPYVWSASGLPDGLSISTSGAISGIPTAAGKGTVRATAMDAESSKESL
jgi:hypothetical protein